MSAISSISFTCKPRVVRAGVPRRIPLVTNGLAGSNGIVFLLHVIPTSSSKCSASLPVKPVLRTSTSITCVSVPPETIVKPFSCNATANAFALSITCCAYTLNSGCNASPNATALAAITCIKGPP